VKRFLISSADDSVVNFQVRIVLAENAEKAIQTYLRRVYAKDEIFRESVLDLSANMSFAERFYLSTDFETQRMQSSGVVGTEPEIVRSRVKSYFKDRPDLGDRYLGYMDTTDAGLITEDLFEYIATKLVQREHGLVAMDIDAIEVIA
jgi:hypothetical protein